MAQDALIGTGFVGSMLLMQRSFDHVFNTKNINKMAGKQFGTVYCAAAPGTKWLANDFPRNDFWKITDLIQSLLTIEAEQFVLISTVDVFNHPVIGDEYNLTDSIYPYGFNRAYLEKVVSVIFPNHLIVRLPGIVGPGIKKGPLLDLKNDHLVENICPTSLYQWYPGMRLVEDCESLIRGKVRLAHLVTPPLLMKDLCPEKAHRMLGKSEAFYALKTTHAGSSPYLRRTPMKELREAILP